MKTKKMMKMKVMKVIMKVSQLKEQDVIHIELSKSYENYHNYLNEFDAIIKSVTNEAIIIKPPVARSSKDWVIKKDDIISLALVTSNGYQEVVFD